MTYEYINVPAWSFDNDRRIIHDPLHDLWIGLYIHFPAYMTHNFGMWNIDILGCFREITTRRKVMTSFCITINSTLS